MKNQIRPILSLFFLFSLLTGVIYPLLVTGISQVFFSKQANGSLIEVNGVSVGSELIGQNFTGMHTKNISGTRVAFFFDYRLLNQKRR